MRPLLLAVALVSLVACHRDTAEQREGAPAPTATSSEKPAEVRNSGPPLVLAPPGVRFAKPEGGDVATAVRNERERAAADGRKVVVYVGATWCEPCQRFHEAAKRGELDADFPDLTIVDFDLDDDRQRLVEAGYVSKLIPLFVAPGADGRASDRRFEGGVKGDGAVRHIVPRLRSLVAR